MEMSVKKAIVIIIIIFIESSKLYFDLHDKIEEENVDKNNENLKYLNDISGNLLQFFEGKDITSNLETNVKFFMLETLCQNFCRKWEQTKCYAGRNKIFSSANIHQFGLLKCLSEIISMWLGVTCVSALYYIWLNGSQHSRRFNKIR